MIRASRLNRLSVGTGEARLMLSAFRQDATQARYADWAALEDYCRRSADPVGRMLLRLHGDGDNGAANAAADGLCTALQVLNHLQDLVPDRAALDRVYLPDRLDGPRRRRGRLLRPRQCRCGGGRCWMRRSTASRNSSIAPAPCRGCCAPAASPGRAPSPSPWPGGCWRSCAPPTRCSAGWRWAGWISPGPSPRRRASARATRPSSPPGSPAPGRPSPAAWRR